MKKITSSFSLLVLGTLISNPAFSNFACPDRIPNPLGENIADHGAIANDGHDDSDAIQCALDMARLNAKKIIIPSGRFVVDKEISLLDNSYNFVQIEGVGWSSIIEHTGGDYAFHVGDDQGSDPSSVIFKDFWIKEINNPDAHAAIFYHHAHRAVVDHMRIDGYSSATAGDQNEGASAIKYQNTWVHTIKDTLIIKAYNGIYARKVGSTDSVNALNVLNSDFEAIKQGVVLGANASVNIRNNTIEGVDLVTAVHCDKACKSLNVVGNYIEQTGSSPSQVVFVGNSSMNSGIVIRENYARLSTTNSYFEVRNGRAVEIEGNTMTNEPVEGGAFIKLGYKYYVKYVEVNNNFASIDGESEPSWLAANIKYVDYVDNVTGAPRSEEKTKFGTLFDNITRAFLMGEGTDLGRLGAVSNEVWHND